MINILPLNLQNKYMDMLLVDDVLNIIIEKTNKAKNLKLVNKNFNEYADGRTVDNINY